jgi:hypothetical protein
MIGRISNKEKPMKMEDHFEVKDDIIGRKSSDENDIFSCIAVFRRVRPVPAIFSVVFKLAAERRQGSSMYVVLSIAVSNTLF